jgi:hypothetical protein
MRRVGLACLVLLIGVSADAQTCEQRWADVKNKTTSVQTQTLVLKSGQKVTAAQLTALQNAETALVNSEGGFESNGCIAPPDTGGGTGGGGQAALIQQGDLAYLGSYEVPTSVASGIEWGQGFALKSGGAQPHFLTFHYSSGTLHLVELAAPLAFGSAVTNANQWDSPNDAWPNGHWIGLSSDGQRVIYTDGEDYPTDANLNVTKGIWTSNLPANGGAMTWRGPFGLQGVGMRQIYGGCQPTPSGFQTRYGWQAFACGWGGYASRFAQGLYPASLGIVAVTSSDPTAGADNTEVAATVLANHASGSTRTDWYASGTPANDRGVRNVNVQNYYDGGDPRQNPSTEPTIPPATGAGWLSPAPDGLGRMTWGASAHNTGLLIDTPTRYGVVTIWSMACGKAWYGTSTLHQDSTCFEMQVFDPAHMDQPTNRWELTFPGLGAGHGGNGPWKEIAGAAFDPATNRIYAYGVQVDGGANRIYVFQLN